MHESYSTESHADVKNAMIFFLYESPSSMIPNNERVAGWIKTFKSRPDAKDFADIIEMCEEYIND